MTATFIAVIDNAKLVIVGGRFSKWPDKGAEVATAVMADFPGRESPLALREGNQ